MRNVVALLSTLLVGVIASPILQASPRAVENNGMEERTVREWVLQREFGPNHWGKRSPRLVEVLNLEVPTGPFPADPKAPKGRMNETDFGMWWKRRNEERTAHPQDSLGRKEERTAQPQDSLGRMQKRKTRFVTGDTSLREILTNTRAHRAQRKADKAQEKADAAQEKADIAWSKAGFGLVSSGKTAAPVQKNEVEQPVVNNQENRGPVQPEYQPKGAAENDNELSLGYRIKVNFQNNKEFGDRNVNRLNQTEAKKPNSKEVEENNRSWPKVIFKGCKNAEDQASKKNEGDDDDDDEKEDDDDDDEKEAEVKVNKPSAVKSIKVSKKVN
ncbi:hypothetical protein QQZ08_001639 [Neonectria magnoliae]|uniref:Uncharacterized protein n=1 Tax=Neonectria magnoliae TaxID=2732573 RepID=A0ABR1IG06_9HYPO